MAFGKRMACQIASRAMRGQEKIDRLQLCMAQAHLDCLKQAIDQKIVGPQCRDFVTGCADNFDAGGEPFIIMATSCRDVQ